MNTKIKPQHRRTLTTFFININKTNIINKKKLEENRKKIKNLEIEIPSITDEEDQNIDCLNSNDLFLQNYSNKNKKLDKSKFSTLKSNNDKKIDNQKDKKLRIKKKIDNKSIIQKKNLNKFKLNFKLKKYLKKRNTTIGNFNLSKIMKKTKKHVKNNKSSKIKKISINENLNNNTNINYNNCNNAYNKELELKLDLISTEFLNYQKEIYEIQKQNVILKEKVNKLNNNKNIEYKMIDKIFNLIKNRKGNIQTGKENILKFNNNFNNIKKEENKDFNKIFSKNRRLF